MVMKNFESAKRAYQIACGEYYSGANKAKRQEMMDTLKPLVAAIQELDLNDPESVKALESFKNNQKYIKDDHEGNVKRGETLVIPPDVGVMREVDLIKISSKIIEIIEAKQKTQSIQTPVYTPPAPSAPLMTVDAAPAEQPKFRRLGGVIPQTPAGQPNTNPKFIRVAELNYQAFKDAIKTFQEVATALKSDNSPSNLKNLKDELWKIIPLAEKLNPQDTKHKSLLMGVYSAAEKSLQESNSKPTEDRNIPKEQILDCLRITALVASYPDQESWRKVKEETIATVRGFRRIKHTENIGRPRSNHITSSPPKPKNFKRTNQPKDDNGRGGR
jgi:hypothetical protein